MLEFILKISLRQRYFIVMITLALGVLGAYSFMQLPIDAVPDITNNQVQINTLYPSLSPDEIEKQITFTVETSLAGIPGLEYSRSISRNGFSQVTAVFRDEVDIYFARQQVGERLAEARENLPEGAEPAMGPISTGLGEVYMWVVEYEHPHGKGAEIKDGEPGWQSDGSYLTPEGENLRNTVELASYLRTIQDWVIRLQLMGLDSLAGVDSIGGYVKQYHVQPDPEKLIAFGLTFQDVIEALEENNVSTGAGYIEHQGEAYNVRAFGRIQNTSEIESIFVKEVKGTPILIRDVATVLIGKELRTGTGSSNSEEVVVGTALMLIGANSRTVSQAVHEKMLEINGTLPPDIVARTVMNRRKLVDATIRTVQKNLAEGAILVIVILVALLGNFRAALLTSLAIPFSMLMTATGMVQAKISGNLMSLGAIDFGLIVDGSVIIVENCLRRLAEEQHKLGRALSLKERLEVVFEASKQVRRATAFGEAIIMMVYVPILALTGIEGKMFHPMAMTVIIALGSAFVLSLTFIPAMVAILITGKVKETESYFIVAAKKIYEPVLRLALKMRHAVVLAGFGSFVAGVYLFMGLGQEFVPTLDEGDIALHAMRIPSCSLSQSTEMQFEVERVVKSFKEVDIIYSKTGTAEVASDPMPPNVSDTFVILKPTDQWPDPDLPKAELIKRMEKALGVLRGNNYEFTQPIQMRFNELIAGVRGDVAVKVFGDEFEDMVVTAQSIARVLQKVPGSADVKAEQTHGLPMMTVKVKREVAGRYGLSVADIQEVVAIAIGGREVGQVFEGDRRFDLVVRLPEKIRGDLNALERLRIPLEHHEEDEKERAFIHHAVFSNETDDAAYIPLGLVADIDIAEGLNQVSRENGKRRVVVQCNVRDRDIGSFVTEAQEAIRTQVKLPPNTWLNWGGQFENLVAARKRLSIVLPICFFLIFMLLYKTFDSARYAILVFTGVPLALSGGVVALIARDMPFSISAGVGFIALSGVAVLNGLVMVTFINELRTNGLSRDEAILEGALTRLRPVLMTALVASLGFVPMALATTRGAEVQRPLATVVIGGLVTSTLLTLVVLPALYKIFGGKKAPVSEDEQ